LLDRQPSGAHRFQDSPAVLAAIRRLRNLASTSIDLRISPGGASTWVPALCFGVQS
jgi:hypothetical protein